jgi:predicted nucleic acid-binding protein
MTRFILLDTSPLGEVARKRPSAAMIAWSERLTTAGARLAIPEICDYEVRREYIRAGLKESLSVLDDLPTVYDYIQLDTPTLRLAADLWADVRNQGKPTADL